MIIPASIASLVLWLIIFLLPWKPWNTREQWVPEMPGDEVEDLGNVTVLIPARNEEMVIGETVAAVLGQGAGIRIIVIDDNSRDQTARIARESGRGQVSVIRGIERPDGWNGKLWALQQGLELVKTPIVMLIDADIKLSPGVIAGLRKRLNRSTYNFLSLMAEPSLNGFWERLLMPAFVFYFKLLYPFRLSNEGRGWAAAAAGGCIMTRADIIREIGGFASIKEALIDDCALAGKVQYAGYSTWVGLTRSVKSIRPYEGLAGIWNMVARTAYPQLYESKLLLLGCTAIMLLAYTIPVAGLFSSSVISILTSSGTLLVMVGIYIPTLKYYELSAWWSLALPLTGVLFLLMTWTSAARNWRGEQVRWRGRIVYKNSNFK